jgi:hypothetical protein
MQEGPHLLGRASWPLKLGRCTARNGMQLSPSLQTPEKFLFEPTTASCRRRAALRLLPKQMSVGSWCARGWRHAYCWRRQAHGSQTHEIANGRKLKKNNEIFIYIHTIHPISPSPAPAERPSQPNRRRVGRLLHAPAGVGSRAPPRRSASVRLCFFSEPLRSTRSD